ncbi:hypothetical protein TRVL_05525 [Trypanosoma vivax]|nr:hypothetical protein TRVL_05525 [Trypanosoma vivax]
MRPNTNCVTCKLVYWQGTVTDDGVPRQPCFTVKRPRVVFYFMCWRVVAVADSPSLPISGGRKQLQRTSRSSLSVATCRVCRAFSGGALSQRRACSSHIASFRRNFWLCRSSALRCLVCSSVASRVVRLLVRMSERCFVAHKQKICESAAGPLVLSCAPGTRMREPLKPVGGVLHNLNGGPCSCEFGVLLLHCLSVQTRRVSSPIQVDVRGCCLATLIECCRVGNCHCKECTEHGVARRTHVRLVYPSSVPHIIVFTAHPGRVPNNAAAFARLMRA